MTDEKQIEEMAKCMCSSYESEKGCKTCPTNWCYADECATMAFCNGYRKLPEGAVVLSREEYERIIKENEKLQNYNDKLSQGIYYGNGEQFCSKLIQSRKETAREIFDKIKEKIAYLKRRYHEDCVDGLGDEEYNGLSEKDLDEIAKQYGVEVE